MEKDEEKKIEMNSIQLDTFVYTIEIVKVALRYGWNIKIFRYDHNLVYLMDVLEDNGISPNAFFNLREFCKQNNIKSSYEWARAVHKKVFEDYDILIDSNDSFLKNLDSLDTAYTNEMDPSDVFTSEELVAFDLQCDKYIELALSN